MTAVTISLFSSGSFLRFLALGVRYQPDRDFVIAEVVEDVLAHQLAYDLRRIQILPRADFLEELLLSRINQDGQSSGAIFLDRPFVCLG